MAEQQERIELLRKSHDNVRNSKAFKIVLQYVLAYGNYMNAGTRKGRAFGFKLNSLKQIVSAKSVDNKVTLLQFLYIEMEKKSPEALQFVGDFSILEEGSRLDISDLSAEVNKIGSSLRKIKKRLKAITSSNAGSGDEDSDDGNETDSVFSIKMTQFLDHAQPHYDTLKKEHDDTKGDCAKLADFFNCHNDIKFEYFKELYAFSVSFKTVGIQLEKQREMEERQKKSAQYKGLLKCFL